MKTRPNHNPILAAMRDDDIAYDPWGTAMAYAFAVAETLHAAGEDVPDELGFQPSPYVYVDADVQPEAYPDLDVWMHLRNHPDRDEAVRDLQTAGRALHLYIELCRAAGRDY